MCYLKKTDKDFFNMNNICSTNHWWINQEKKYMLLKRLFSVQITYKKNFHQHEWKKYGNSSKKHSRKKFVTKKTHWNGIIANNE